jgi:hypothetical protein
MGARPGHDGRSRVSANVPQAALLGVGAARAKLARAKDGEIV